MQGRPIWLDRERRWERSARLETNCSATASPNWLRNSFDNWTVLVSSHFSPGMYLSKFHKGSQEFFFWGGEGVGTGVFRVLWTPLRLQAQTTQQQSVRKNGRLGRSMLHVHWVESDLQPKREFDKSTQLSIDGDRGIALNDNFCVISHVNKHFIGYAFKSSFWLYPRWKAHSNSEIHVHCRLLAEANYKGL